MKVGYPYMGTVVIYKKLMELMGFEVIPTPRPTRKTLDLGVKNSPEFACFPYKAIMGSYIELAEMGVERIFTSGGRGACRAGLYEQVHRKTLHKLGYDVDLVVFDLYKNDYLYGLKNIKKIKGDKSWFRLFRVFLTCYAMAHALDKLERQVETLRAYETEKGAVSKVWNEIQERFDREVKRKRDIKPIEEDANKALKAIPVEMPEENKRLRIGIVGEIYVVMESAINLNIEEVLNNLGCEVRRDLYLSEWVDDNLMPGFLNRGPQKKILKKSRRYMEMKIGGHENETIGHIIDFKEKGYDGIIHLMPFSCLPELVTHTLLPTIIDDVDIPVLTLSLDEQTAIANQRTRIEAFIDLIKNRQKINS